MKASVSMSMKTGIFKTVLSCAIILIPLSAKAQKSISIEEYRRSSLYSLAVVRPEYPYGEEIGDAFLSIPIPEKFNDHNLNRRILHSVEHKKNRKEPVEITYFLEKNAIGRRLMAKWFDRDPESGAFDMSLIQQRGYYDADFFDIEIAKMTKRGTAILADAGQDLIKNTFVIVNEFYYVDKESRASVARDWFSAIAELASISDHAVAQAISATSHLGAAISEDITGFRVVIISHLYQLDYSENMLNTFYEHYYFDSANINKRKKAEFDNEMSLFKLKYIGTSIVDSQKTSSKGVNLDTPEEMITKVCTRALDKSIVELQKSYEVFRVKTPLYSTDSVITAKIGLKEGVSERSRFEVLETFLDENGMTSYRRIGVIEPVKGQIWDNRFMAVEEDAENSMLGATTFRKISGGRFSPGMLIREIKFN